MLSPNSVRQINLCISGAQTSPYGQLFRFAGDLLPTNSAHVAVCCLFSLCRTESRIAAPTRPNKKNFFGSCRSQIMALVHQGLICEFPCLLDENCHRVLRGCGLLVGKISSSSADGTKTGGRVQKVSHCDTLSRSNGSISCFCLGQIRCQVAVMTKVVTLFSLATRL